MRLWKSWGQDLIRSLLQRWSLRYEASVVEEQTQHMQDLQMDQRRAVQDLESVKMEKAHFQQQLEQLKLHMSSMSSLPVQSSTVTAALDEVRLRLCTVCRSHIF